MENLPISHLISNPSKRFQNVFMISITSLKPSSMQYDVHLWNFGLPDFIFGNKAGYALARGYVVIDRLIAQCPRNTALATIATSPAPLMAPHIRICVFIFPSMRLNFSRWRLDSKLLASEQQSTNQWVTLRMLRPFLLYSLWVRCAGGCGFTLRTAGVQTLPLLKDTAVQT